MRAGNGWAFGGHLVAHDRLGAGSDDGFVGSADRDRFVRQIVKFLEVGITEHQTVGGIPQHEGFRDGFDRIAQAQIRLDGALDQSLLFGHVDGDADQVQAWLAVLAYQFATGPQPHPMAVGVAHAEGMIDRGGVGFRKLFGDLVETHVVGVNEGADFAEGQQVVFGFQTKNAEHRLRPKDAAAREVPIP
jgi:hypothetical protein